jgi:hypothetical protein
MKDMESLYLPKMYSFPPAAPREYRNLNFSECDNKWGTTCYNCATYAVSIGIKVIEEGGMFNKFLPALAKQQTSHCR